MSRVALVTGGTRGIGAAIARALKEAGYTVAANYAGNTQAAQAFADETGIAVYRWDVSDEAACAEGVARVERDLGPIDILVNNAGITRDAFLHKMTGEMWRAVIDTDLSSLFYMCRPVVPGMRERGFGRIINISSVNAQLGQMGQTNYAAAKAGMIGFTRALAQELAARGITVNAIAPGYCETDMVRAVPEEIIETRILPRIPVGRLGRPEEIARAVLFLADDEAGFITGATLSINGGQCMI